MSRPGAAEAQHAVGPAPRVSMGMPVFNGGDYLEEALRSLLGQTFSDFELIISDNASSDRTPEICRTYASMDERVRYYRNPVNVGYARNQNRVIELSRGEYFLVTHADDVRAPEYVARTLDVLEADTGVVVCYSKTRDIDAHGNPVHRKEISLRVDSRDVRERFREVIRMDHICEPVFGLTRAGTLKRTRLHGLYADSDRVLLAELGLHGRFFEIPEYLFYRRAHAKQSTAVAPDRHSRTIWFDPGKQGHLMFPHFRQFREYLSVIRGGPITRRQQLVLSADMLRWLRTNRHRLFSDLREAARHVARPVYRKLVRAFR